MDILLVGSTGLVGKQVLELALADPLVQRVVAPTRRQLPGHDKLVAPFVDYEHLPDDAPWWNADAVICTLGTTMRAAGSRQAFRRVDHDYPLEVARRASIHGTPTFVLNSAIGASVSSRFFYNRVKGELEDDLATLPFSSLTYVRPGLIDGHRSEFRLGERLFVNALRQVDSILPRAWRLNPAHEIAMALLQAAKSAPAGVHVVASDQMV
ncbi:NAD-dependent dehydratase [Cupriavidus pauculus]|uniref:NAD-dependent dehydratase n=1 Tax=Cupriavidus pauculus TaxID=82633 RepID=A0A2N5C3G4_9BURK|nr:NAD-dependent dehydratase [Cupriavidus pauculus]PLP96769.1 NAD-dependent dehydratase [Cupriavidus pauculus]